MKVFQEVGKDEWEAGTEKEIYRAIYNMGNEGFPRCHGLLATTGIKRDKVHKTLL